MLYSHLVVLFSPFGKEQPRGQEQCEQSQRQVWADDYGAWVQLRESTFFNVVLPHTDTKNLLSLSSLLFPGANKRTTGKTRKGKDHGFEHSGNSHGQEEEYLKLSVEGSTL